MLVLVVISLSLLSAASIFLAFFLLLLQCENTFAFVAVEEVVGTLYRM